MCKPLTAYRWIVTLVVCSLVLQPGMAASARTPPAPAPATAPEARRATESNPLAMATDVGGPITSDTTWTLSSSPYIVTDSVTVADGVTLTI